METDMLKQIRSVMKDELEVIHKKLDNCVTKDELQSIHIRFNTIENELLAIKKPICDHTISTLKQF